MLEIVMVYLIVGMIHLVWVLAGNRANNLLPRYIGGSHSIGFHLFCLSVACVIFVMAWPVVLTWQVSIIVKRRRRIAR